MYAKSAHIYGFKCFGKAVFDLTYPGRDSDADTLALENVNLILGDNGGGKSSVLRAIAIAMLAPALMDAGFVAHRLVRRPDADDAFLKVWAVLDPDDHVLEAEGQSELELIARIDRVNSRRDLDRLHTESTPESPLEKLIYDDRSHAFFVVGYGATRRVETGDFSPSSARKMRGDRYARVASLFEDHIALRPLEALLDELGERREEALAIINGVLPAGLSLTGDIDKGSGQAFAIFKDQEMPFSSLSDGYRAFLGMTGDLVGHLAEVAPSGLALDEVPGIVLIDEVDLHLHPSWQRRVVNDLAATFPKLQFIMTSHSPLIAGSVHSDNILLTEEDPETDTATIARSDESVYGQSVDRLLMSAYFGLDATRPEAAVRETDNLVQQAMRGDKDAAIAVLESLSKPASATKGAGAGRTKAPRARSKPAAKRRPKTKS